jgi:membrane protein implicated in regulation of membrane protease activity
MPAIQAPGSEVIISGSMEAWEMALILLVVLGAVVALAYPFIRRLAGKPEREMIRALEQRIAELEERVEFTERLLPAPEPARKEGIPPAS